jgi:phage gp46-like protein
MDIELFWDPQRVRYDFGFSAGDLATDHDIKTAVIISLFTDRRAQDDDALPDPAMSKRGWWGDAFGAMGTGRQIGSRLWLLSREKQIKEVQSRAREYAVEALKWLVDDGVASNVTVDAQVVQTGMLGLVVVIEREKRPPARYRFEFAWTNINQVRN